MKSNQHLIDQPSLKSRRRRVIETLTAASAWSILLYLAKPLLTVAAWLVSGYWLSSHVFNSLAASGTLTILLHVLLFATLVVIFFAAWAKWNLYFYGGLDRRKAHPAITVDAIAAQFALPPALVKELQSAKVMNISFSATQTPQFSFYSLLK